MTESEIEQLRISVATLRGWKHKGPRFGAWIKPEDNSGDEYLMDAIPNYPKDLNACYEFENWLLDQGDLWGEYCDAIMNLIIKEGGYQAGEMFVHASAVKRCLAFITVMKNKNERTS